MAPVVAVLALAVRLDSPGPAIYREWRLGRGGRAFRIHKLRTLHDGHGEERAVAPPGDPRITRLGHYLRRTHVDELPQLFDVCRGAMSLVGPRPAKLDLWRAVSADLRARVLAVRPGLTSSVTLRFLCEDAVLAELADPEAAYRDILFPARVAQEARELERRSVAGDARVMLRTVAALVGRRDEAACRERLAALLGTPERAPEAGSGARRNH